MPPRHAYWTILIGDAPTAFRAHDRADLLPTYERLRQKQPDVTMKYFRAREALGVAGGSARRDHAPARRQNRAVASGDRAEPIAILATGSRRNATSPDRTGRGAIGRLQAVLRLAAGGRRSGKPFAKPPVVRHIATVRQDQAVWSPRPPERAQAV
jgi:hypothetical protein